MDVPYRYFYYHIHIHIHTLNDGLFLAADRDCDCDSGDALRPWKHSHSQKGASLLVENAQTLCGSLSFVAYHSQFENRCRGLGQPFYSILLRVSISQSVNLPTITITIEKSEYKFHP